MPRILFFDVIYPLFLATPTKGVARTYDVYIDIILMNTN
nr:MAG TPA: hypothetical protein [Caudoviricetes sp.]